MIKVKKHIHGIALIDIWFADAPIKDRGIINYKEAGYEIDGGEPFYTLITDLTEESEDIIKRFSSNCRNQVKRAYRDGSEFEIVSSEDMTEQDIEQFVTFFDEFWRSKGSKLDNPDVFLDDMKHYREEGILTITKGIVDGECCVYHTYLCDDNTARLLHSASHFRLLQDENNNSIRQVIGRANRMLHYEDMLYFKNKGLKKYDWGGAGKDEEVASITEFKESFGGTPVTYYDGTVENGIKAKTVVALSTIKRKLTGR